MRLKPKQFGGRKTKVKMSVWVERDNGHRILDIPGLGH